MITDAHTGPQDQDVERAMVAFRERMVNELPQLKRSLTAATRELAEFIVTLPSDQLLARAALERANALQDAKADSDIGFDETLGLRASEYLQSVIVSVPPSPSPKAFVSEVDWKKTWNLLGSVFRLQDQVNIADAIANPSATSDSPTGGAALRSIMPFLYSVRGKNYPVHIPAYLEDVLSPFSDLFKSALGVNAADLISGLVSIVESVPERAKQHIEIRNHAYQALLAGGYWTPSPCNVEDPRIPDVRTAIADTLDADDVMFTGSEELLNPAYPFVITESCSLPSQLLDALSWGPGEESTFFNDLESPSWPIKTWPTRLRPFFKMDGRHYCFDFVFAADHIFDVLRQLVWNQRPDLRNAWYDIQGAMTEGLARKYLNKLLPNSNCYPTVHYRAPLNDKPISGECDAVIIYDDHLLIVEAKSARFGEQSPATDFDGYVKKVRECSESAVRQGDRLRSLLTANDSITLYDTPGKKKNIAMKTLYARDYRHITVIAVSLEPFTEFASRYNHLSDIGISPGSGDTWVVSVDDLRLIADIFDNPLIFLHYLEMRAKAMDDERLYVDDELDHLALYLSHNDYSRDPDGGYNGVEPDMIWNIGIRDILDWQLQPLNFGDTVEPIRQDMPARFQEVIDMLSTSNRKGKTEVASLLLDAGGAWRRWFAEAIDGRLRRIHETGAMSDFSPQSTEGANVTVYCSVQGIRDDSGDQMVRYAKTLLVMQDEAARLLLKLTYSTLDILSDVAFRWIRQDDISPLEREGYVTLGVKLRKNRIEREQARKIEEGLPRHERRLGRNKPCPCGSGKKYKRCCLDRLR